MSAPTFTERQAAAWPKAIEEIRRYAPQAPVDPRQWTLDWADEVRPGRGHFLNATWLDGENFAQILMDVYGGPSVSVADIDWIHANSDEECGCDYCVEEREADA